MKVANIFQHLSCSLHAVREEIFLIKILKNLPTHKKAQNFCSNTNSSQHHHPLLNDVVRKFYLLSSRHLCCCCCCCGGGEVGVEINFIISDCQFSTSSSYPSGVSRVDLPPRQCCLLQEYTLSCPSC